jgi:hypothetical protein
MLERAARAGAKGATSPVTSRTNDQKRLLYGQALEALEAERAVYVDRSKAKPRYFSREYAPTMEGAAAKMEQLAARRHPALVTMVELKKGLSANEKTLVTQALESLEIGKRIVKFIHGKSVLFAHGDSLRALLGTERQPVRAVAAASDEAIRHAYENLVRLKGFPFVEIAALQHHSEVPMPALKDWLLALHRRGLANFGSGDWSLSDEETRAGVIEMRGERYLLVRLED